MVKKILLGLFALVVLLLLLGLVLPKEVRVEREVIIEAPVDAIFAHVTHFTKREAWYPWSQLDPNMETRLEGIDGQEGATYHWTGNKAVGTGQQTLTRITPNKRLETELTFIEPFASMATTYMDLIPTDGGTRVVWGMDTQMPYPMNLMLLTGMLQKNIGKDYDQGLSNLKEIVEQEM